jgi:hypothetical protein
LGRNVIKDKKLKSYLINEGVDIDFAISVEEGYDDGGIYKGDGELYLENHEGGYCLLFKTENAVFESRSKMPIVDGDWIFSTIFVYREGKDGYSNYRGSLPYNISLFDRVDDIGYKIGSFPDFVNDYVHTWRQPDGYDLSASAVEDGKPNIVIFSMKSGERK